MTPIDIGGIFQPKFVVCALKPYATFIFAILEQLRATALPNAVGVRTIPSKRRLEQAIEPEIHQKLEDEEVLLAKYSENIQQLFDPVDSELPRFTYYWRMSTTAVAFFRRFYLNNSLLQYEPRLAM